GGDAVPVGERGSQLGLWCGGGDPLERRRRQLRGRERSVALAARRLRLRQAVRRLPRQRRVADRARDVECRAEILSGVRGPSGMERDLPAEQEEPADVLSRASGSGGRESALDRTQRLLVAAEREERTGDAEQEVDRPAPAVGAEGLLGADERLLELREGLGRDPQVELVEAQVDARARLDVAVLDAL